MSAPEGFVYCAVNATNPGLIKIGVTTKDPVQRMKELTAAPGVVSPFALAYSRRVAMPFEVEADIHRRLENRRVSESREFFTITLREAIEMVEQYPERPDLAVIKLQPLPFAELFATFADDGSGRELTVLERAECVELARQLGWTNFRGEKVQ